jgi:hypothetical protein
MENKVIEYGVANGSDCYRLEEDVNAYISQGWQPHGSVLFSPNNGWFYQPMVKYSLTPKPTTNE